MVRKLEEKDRQMTLDFLNHEPAINLFIIGDIENFGFDEDFQDLGGSFRDDLELNGVLLKYNQSYIPYFRDAQCDISRFRTIIQKK